MQPANTRSPFLALDTSTRAGTVALGNGQDVLAQVSLGVHVRHAEALLPAIEFAMHQAGVGRHELGAIVVGSGPGSFTGVRIAGATAKGLAHSLGVPLFGYSSLLAVAVPLLPLDRSICVLFDAQRGEVYGAAYRLRSDRADVLETLISPRVGPLDELLGSADGHDLLFVGDGAVRFESEIHAGGYRVGPPMLASPQAASLLWLAETVPAIGRVAEPNRWTPTYLRPPSAKVPASMSEGREAPSRTASQ